MKTIQINHRLNGLLRAFTPMKRIFHIVSLVIGTPSDLEQCQGQSEDDEDPMSNQEEVDDGFEHEKIGEENTSEQNRNLKGG